MKYQKNKGKICIAPGCNNKARAKGLCFGCYQKWKRNNNKLIDVKSGI